MSCILRRLPVLLGMLVYLATSLSAAAPEDYTLAPQDLVTISVFRQPDLQVEQRIDASGQVSIPLIGGVQIAGMSTRQAENAIAKAFVDGQFLRNPQVSVSIQQYAERGCSVIGEVKSPGFIKFDIERGYMDIREVIAQAGGFTSVARKGDIKVIRHEGDNEQVVNVDFGDLVDRNRAQAFLVRDGDVVMVPARIF